MAGEAQREWGRRGRGRGAGLEGRGGADTTSDIRSEKTELIKPAAKGRNSRRRGAEIKNVNLRDWKPQSRHDGGSPRRFPTLASSQPPMAFPPICDFYYNRLNRNLQPSHRRGRDPTAERFLLVRVASYYPGCTLSPVSGITVSANQVRSYCRDLPRYSRYHAENRAKWISDTTSIQLCPSAIILSARLRTNSKCYFFFANV